MKPTLFTVEPEHLAALGPDIAVEFFAELLWAEARRVGISVGQISISSRVTAPDGGVDATFSGSLPANASTFLMAGPSAYHVKAGATFKPAQGSPLFGLEILRGWG